MQKIGVVAVFDTANFMSGLNLYTQGLAMAIDQTLKAQRVFNSLKTSAPKITIQNIGEQNVGTQNLVNQVARATAGYTQFGQAVDSTNKKLSFSETIVAGVALKIGSMLTQAATNAIASLGGIAEAAFNASAEYEKLTFSIEALVAREIMNAGAAGNMTDALALAGPRAEELLKWITQLAILSPFDEAGVRDAFQTALAYGFTSEEAQRLTQDMVDLTSATGRGSQMLDRISLALGQMRAKGKVTSGELKQLTEAGVDISSILKQMGVGLDDVATGTVRADEFIRIFAETMERDFGGAAARQAGTLSGLANSLKDLQVIILRTTFGPMFKAFEPVLQNIVTGLQNAMPAFSAFGELLGSATSLILNNADSILHLTAVFLGFIGGLYVGMNAINILVGLWNLLWLAIGGTATLFAMLLTPTFWLTAALIILGVVIGGLVALWIGTLDELSFSTSGTLGGMANDMITYGYNIIISFANGMADAITAVIDVLIQLGHIITNWLAPGSPPKLLPELDTWGTEAMNVYLDGWTKADWSIFEDISKTMENYLRSLGKDIIPEDQLIPTILNTRSALETLVQQYRDLGVIGRDALAAVANAMNIANGDLLLYIRNVVAVEDANKAVAAAQANLNNITSRYANLLKPINRELDAISKRRKEVSDAQRTEELQGILSDPDADPLAKELALLELREMELNNNKNAIEEQQKVEEDLAKQRLDDAMAAKKMAEDQLAAQKALIDSQIDTNKLMKEQIALLQKLAEQGGATGNGTGGSGGGAKIDPPDFSGLGGGGGFGDPTEKIKNQFSDMIIDLTYKLAFFIADLIRPFEPVFEKIEELKSVWEDTFGTIEGVWKKLSALDWQAIWDKFVQDVATNWENYPKTIDAGWKNATKPISDWLNGSAEDFGKWLSEVGAFFQSGWTGFQIWMDQNINDPLNLFFYDANEGFGKWVDDTINFLADIGDGLLEWINQTRTDFSNWVTGIGEFLNQGWIGIQQWIDQSSESFTFWVEDVIESIGGFIEWVINGLADLGDQWMADFKKMQEDAGKVWGDIWTTITTKATEIYNGVVQWFTDLGNWIQTSWNDLVTKTEIAWNDLWSKITIAATGIYDDVVEWITSTWDWLVAKWAEFATDADTQWKAIWKSVTDAVTGAATDIGTQLLAAKTTFDTKLAEITTAVNTVFTSTGTLQASIGSGMLTAYNSVKTQFEDMVKLAGEQTSKFLKAGEDMIAGIIQGIANKTQSLLKVVGDLIDDAIAEIARLLGNPHSPAPVTIPLGKSVVQGLDKGIKDSITMLDNAVAKINVSLTGIEVPEPMPAINQYARRRVPPILENLGRRRMPPIPGDARYLGPPIQEGFSRNVIPSNVLNGSGNTNSVTLNMDNISINNGMDLDNFAGYIRDVIVNSIDSSLGSGI